MTKQNANMKLNGKSVRATINRPKGITLIALVITIVVLIILAGVAINLSLGENGIFTKAKEAKERQSESSAREKLELVLVDARIEKETNTSYNSEDYLTKMLENENITVSGDSVIVDNYNFLIDRKKLVILESLGETHIKVTAEVQEYLGKNENDKYAVSILIVVESNLGLESVVIQNPDGSTFKIETQQAIQGKNMEVELDEEYILTVTTQDGTTETRKIVEKSVENIRTAEELAAFRDKVNTGLTYEGKTINVVKDIDLSSVCYEVDGTKDNDISWEPISITSATPFKGTFNGNYHNIDNLYINNTNSATMVYQGLFGICSGSIENLNIQSGTIKITAQVNGVIGTITGVLDGGNIRKCSSNVTLNISGTADVGGIVGVIQGNSLVESCKNSCDITATSNDWHVGGIVADQQSGTVTLCENYGTITHSGTACHYAGGIAGVSRSTLNKCINKGKVVMTTGLNYSSIGGITGLSRSTVSQCVNFGELVNTIQYENRTGGIVGSSSGCTILDCYNRVNISVSTSVSASDAGGILGHENSSTTITNCYNMGTVTGYRVGGITGYGGTLKNTYSIRNTSTSKDGTYKSLEEMKKDTFITTLGSEFAKDEDNKNEGFPILNWQKENNIY